MSTGREGKEHELERWLDAALARGANVEPRPGLENRVLVTLQVERERLTQPSRWWWVLAVSGTAAAAVIAMWIGLHTRQPLPDRTSADSTTHRLNVIRPELPDRPRHVEHARVLARGPRPPARSKAVKDATGPRLNQFPSPQPLTDQEQTLSRYVHEFPDRAILVARAQTQLRKQEEQEMLTPNSKTTGAASSDQPE